MRNPILLIVLLPLLAACASVQENSKRAGRNLNEGVLALRQKMIDYTEPSRRTKPAPPPPLQSAYCYKTQADVLCYRDPLPGQEGRLIGYQEPFEGGARYAPEPSMQPAAENYVPAESVAPLMPISAAPLSAPSSSASPLPEKTPFGMASPPPAGASPAAAGDSAPFAPAPLPKSGKKEPSSGPQELMPVKER